MATILLVDDSHSIRALLATALTGAGYTVIEAGDGRKALLLAQSLPFDVIVTDIYMPEGDGLELLTGLSMAKRRPPVIAMSSATGHMNMLRSARCLGATVTLQKPFPTEELLQRIATLLPAQPLQNATCS